MKMQRQHIKGAAKWFSPLLLPSAKIVIGKPVYTNNDRQEGAGS